MRAVKADGILSSNETWKNWNSSAYPALLISSFLYSFFFFFGKKKLNWSLGELEEAKRMIVSWIMMDVSNAFLFTEWTCSCFVEKNKMNFKLFSLNAERDLEVSHTHK